MPNRFRQENIRVWLAKLDWYGGKSIGSHLSCHPTQNCPFRSLRWTLYLIPFKLITFVIKIYLPFHILETVRTVASAWYSVCIANEVSQFLTLLSMLKETLLFNFLFYKSQIKIFCESCSQNLLLNSGHFFNRGNLHVETFAKKSKVPYFQSAIFWKISD